MSSDSFFLQCFNSESTDSKLTEFKHLGGLGDL